MATQQNVVYYDGVPYVSTAPQPQSATQSGYWGQGGLGGFGGNQNGGYMGMGSLGGLNSRLQPQLSFDQMMEKGYLTPLQTGPRAPTKPVQPLTQMPQAGWGAPQQGGGQPASLDAILNGSAPQFAAAPGPAAQPQQGQMPPPAQGMPTPGAPQMANAMPNPMAPQQNFDALGKNLMSQVLSQGGAR